MTFYPLEEKMFIFISQLQLLTKIRPASKMVKNYAVASKNTKDFYLENNLTDFFSVSLGGKTERY